MACDHCARSSQSAEQGLFEITAMFTLAIVLLAVLRRFGLPALAFDGGGAVSLSAVFLVGVAASLSSCLALVGGLLLSVSAAWCEGQVDVSNTRKFAPLALFNIGRVIGYALLGGVIGVIGKGIGLSIASTGMLTIVLSILMLLLGLKILHLLPKRFCTLPLPQWMWKRMRSLSASRNPIAPMVLGALTFFVPCGFTQSAQALALVSGGFASGAMIMLMFSLGTLPALLGISLISALAEGTFGRLFFKFSGALVVLLAVLNIQSGLVLTGFDPLDALRSGLQVRARATEDPYVTIDTEGRQILSLSVSDQGYSPSSFTVDANRPTWVYAVAPEGVSGCASRLTAPAFNVSVAVKRGGNWLGPITPNKDFVIACSMGMFKTNVHVRG